MDDVNSIIDRRDHAAATRGQSGQPAFASSKPARAHWIGMLFGLGIVGMSVASVVTSLPYQPSGRLSVLEGEATRSFESHYDEALPVKTFGTNLWAAIQYLLFGEGRSGVVVGEGGWLYTSEEFRAYEDADAQIESRLKFIDQTRAQLKERGVDLVIALLPAKTRLYPEHLDGHRPASVHRDLYARLHGELKLRGVAAPDLLAAMSLCKARMPVFLRTDTHWTPEGATCAARAVAAAIGPVKDSPKFETEKGSPEDHAGDLLQFLPLSPHFDWLLPPPDVVRPRSTLIAGGADALLADAALPRMVLIGTSYSAEPRWNFDGALRDSIGEDILNLAEPGRGPFAPMRDYLAKPPAEISPRRVIWEIPERYFPAPDPVKGPQKSAGLAHGGAP